mmetsp:Transcript_70994/g.199155  ORF Transcript_70994/g.199155 Transcript_70994/m.199155 type:complete len:278 (-) Transcript_70994:51-884(-)
MSSLQGQRHMALMRASARSAHHAAPCRRALPVGAFGHLPRELASQADTGGNADAIPSTLPAFSVAHLQRTKTLTKNCSLASADDSKKDTDRGACSPTTCQRTHNKRSRSSSPRPSTSRLSNTSLPSNPTVWMLKIPPSTTSIFLCPSAVKRSFLKSLLKRAVPLSRRQRGSPSLEVTRSMSLPFAASRTKDFRWSCICSFEDGALVQVKPTVVTADMDVPTSVSAADLDVFTLDGAMSRTVGVSMAYGLAVSNRSTGPGLAAASLQQQAHIGGPRLG